MAKLMLLFLAVYAVFHVQGGSLYDQRFMQEVRDLDPLEKFDHTQSDPLEQLLKMASSGQRNERREDCRDTVSSIFCREFKSYCGLSRKSYFRKYTNNYETFQQKCCATCSEYLK
ncbi:uncharacterized protein [Montipora foliosa]|uniref:uncharacterized protein n=1 Tax=Montipora foliosa TaxID=591990 RepID=UPI0035F1AD57